MSTKIIIALCLSSTLTAATTFKSATACAKYCEYCSYDQYQSLYICTQCLRRKFINNQQCSSTPAPASNHCDIYIGYHNGMCAICEEGYLFQARYNNGWA